MLAGKACKEGRERREDMSLGKTTVRQLCMCVRVENIWRGRAKEEGRHQEHLV